MSSYDTQYHCGTPLQNYDQYETSNDSNLSSPRTRSSISSQKQRDDFSTPSPDGSNEADESLNYYNLNEQSKYINLNSIVYNGNPVNNYFNQTESIINYNGENVLQTYPMGNFDPNYVSNMFGQSNTTSETKPVIHKTKSQNSDNEKSSLLMQPPDSESLESATANAQKRRPQRRSRTKFEKEQLDKLESAFIKTHYPDVNMIDRLSRICNLSTERISVWFQNRRARFKRSKKGAKDEPQIPNHNPLFDETEIYNNTETDNFSIKKLETLDEERSRMSAYDSDEDTYKSVETLPVESKKVQKGIFNPMTIPHSSSNQNLVHHPYVQIPKMENYYSDSQNLKVPILTNNVTDQRDDENSSNQSNSSSRNSSPKPKSDSSSSSPDSKQISQDAYQSYANLNPIYNPQVNFPPHLLNMVPYQTGFNNNFYMPQFQPYAQNLPSIFQSYIDYNKTEAPNGGYFQGINPQTLQSYYGNI